MHPNEVMIHQFYEAFNRGDASAMAACYHQNVTFSDPVFLNLEGSQVSDMWEMLCRQASQLDVRSSDIQADDSQGSARWFATYQFGKQKRTVKNSIVAHFDFQDGKIIRHEDHFNFWRWSRMALGPLGLVLGWHPSVKKKISEQALRNLTHFTESKKAV